LVLTRTARKELEGFPLKHRRQIEETLDRLIEALNARRRPQDMRALHGRRDAYRIDTGEYRALFILSRDDRLIIVGRIGHRKDVYRNL
jgi:mRNA-degrading endonuclease RelE of RelBE toxin-antitoxin system